MFCDHILKTNIDYSVVGISMVFLLMSSKVLFKERPENTEDNS